LKYSYSDNEETFSGNCGSIAEALSEALDNYDDDECAIYVGENTQKTIGEYFDWYDVESILEELQESASEECREVAEDWLQGPKCPRVAADMPREEKDMIQQAWKDRKKNYLESLAIKVRAALEEWATENDEQPGFWHVGNIKSYTRDEAITISEAE
jgi:hypothetical protein